MVSVLGQIRSRLLTDPGVANNRLTLSVVRMLKPEHVLSTSRRAVAYAASSALVQDMVQTHTSRCVCMSLFPWSQVTHVRLDDLFGRNCQLKVVCRPCLSGWFDMDLEQIMAAPIVSAVADR